MRALPISCGALLLALASASAQTRIDLGGGQTIELIRVEPGTFQQGSPPDEAGRGPDETPRTVTLTKPFLLGKFPVTRAQFARFVAETNYRTDAESGASGGFGWDGAKLVQRKDFTWRNPGFPQTDEHPVTLVSYKDADAFLRWLSRKSGRAFSLPSEAQWEYAARAGGNAASGAAWNLENSGNAAHPVGAQPANAWGFGDLLGNVWEWCEDWYAPYAPGDAIDPLQRNANLSDKPRRVLRGGSWLREAKFCRPAARYRNDALSRNADNGFRAMTFQIEAPALAAARTAPAPPLVELEATAQREPAVVHDPPAHAARTPPADSRGIGFRWLLAVPVIGIFLAILVAVLKAIARPLTATSAGSVATLSSRAQALRVRVAEDGFWIDGDGLATGARISCHYSVNGSPQQLNVKYEPGPQGQFVFTGARPSNVAVSIDPGSLPSRTTRTAAAAAATEELIDDDPPFSGHPSAY